MKTDSSASNLARYIRLKSLLMVAKINSSHIGSCLSAAEIIAVVHQIVQNSHDVFICSKGHAAAAFYASLSGLKIIPESMLDDFSANDSELIGHVSHKVNGISFSTGSLGHGFPLGVGVAIASKSKHVYVLISDGELNEGTTWESLALASQLKLNNITLVVDANGLQSFGKTDEVVNLEPLIDKFVSFGWSCLEVDGHSISSLSAALKVRSNNKPKVIIARTTKGKGIKEMENKLEWHYKSPNKEELEIFIKEIGG
jgi:transketolase